MNFLEYLREGDNLSGKISVIVPVYNVAKYLTQCVESLLEQSYANIEIILVDDGSNDDSPYICDQFEKKDCRVQVIHKCNEGLGLTRNVGIEASTGEYIVFIDSDDFAHKDMLAELVRLREENNCDTVIGGHCRVDIDGKIFSKHQYDNLLFTGEEILHTMLPRMIGSAPGCHDSIAMSSCNNLYSSYIIKNFKVSFVSERVVISEDMLFNIHYFVHSHCVALTDKCYYYYRENPVSLTRRYLPDRFEKSKAMYSLVKKEFEDLGLSSHTEFRAETQLFISLKACIRQEIRQSSTFGRTVQAISKITSDDLVVQILNDFPVSKMGFKQASFLYLIKYKMDIFLYAAFILLKNL